MEIKSYDDIINTFPTEDSALAYLEKLRWNGIVVSPFSQNSKVYHCPNHKYKCRDTGKYFNARNNTIFHNSRISLRKWFAAIWMIAIDKSDITSVALANKLNITQKTAWYMMRRIREEFDVPKLRKVPKRYSLRQSLESIEVITDPDKLRMSDWLNMLKK